MQYLYWVYLFIVGASFGSFINVLASRLPRGESLWGRSHCDYCQKALSPLELVPVFSYLFLGGRCYHCRKSIPPSYFLVEVISGFLFLAFILHFETLPLIQLGLILIALLLVIALSVSDLLYQIIPDEFLVLLFLLGVALNFETLIYYFSGALLCATIFWFIHHLSQGRAMGFADIKYVFVIGFYLPLPSLLLALYLAFLTGGIISLGLVITKRKKLSSSIAFGPFLSVGFLIALWFAK